MTEQQTTTDELDRIDRSVDIDASAERVFDLVARPGWWIADGELDPAPRLRDEGDRTVLTHPEWGEFTFVTVSAERPSYVAIRWFTQTGDLDAPSTLVEFFVTERPGGVTLRVVESGFSSLDEPREDWMSRFADHSEGWPTMLGAFHRFVTRA